MDTTLTAVLVEDIKIREDFNARKGIPEDDVRGLRYSMDDVGQLNVISVVRRQDGKFDLIAGEKRLLAAQLAKKRTIDARIFEDLTAEQQLRIMLDENLVRKSLNVIEEAEAFSRLIEFRAVDQVASLYRLSSTYVRERLDLLKLPRDVQRMMVRANNPLRIHQALLLASLNNPSDQIQLARHVAPSVATANLPESEVRNMIRQRRGERDLPLDPPPAAPRDRAARQTTAPAQSATRRTRSAQDAPVADTVTNEPQGIAEPTTAPAGAPAGKSTAQVFGDVLVDGDAVYLEDVTVTVSIGGRLASFRQPRLFLDLSVDNREIVTEAIGEGVPDEN